MLTVQLSVAVASQAVPETVYVQAPRSTTSFWFPPGPHVTMAGSCVSVTVTSNVHVDVFPFPSVEVIVIVVFAVITVVAAGDCVIVGVPTQLSVADANVV